MVNKQRFRRELVKWYRLNKRSLPWREEKDPYKIWISEIILQQTRVEQGLAYYIRFIKAFPTVKSLANAPEDKVLKLWEGLGYYSRARNLQAAAKMIMTEMKGQFPTTHDEIIRLKGVGVYTAAAISSFAFGEEKAVVDGNVYRLLSRLFGIGKAIDSTLGKKEFAALAQELIKGTDPAEFNQSIMEFGSRHCKVNDPFCSDCVFAGECFAFKTNSIKNLPFKEKKNKVSERHFNYVIHIDKNKKVRIEKRSANDIWKGLYEFELIETNKAIDPKKFLATLKKNGKKGKSFDVSYVSKEHKHILSHRIIYARFYVIKSKTSHPSSGLTLPVGSLTKFAFPRLIEKFLKDCKLSELF
jgi:A/G-specific adenine glycosylase